MEGKIRFGIVFVNFILIFAFATTANAVKPKHPGDPSLVPPWWERTQLIKKLELSDDQKSKITDIHTEQANKIVRAREIFLNERREMSRFLHQDSLDDDKAEKHMDSVSAAFSVLLKAEMDVNYAMLRELHPEQRRTVLAAIEKQFTKAKHVQAKRKGTEKRKGDKRYNRF